MWSSKVSITYTQYRVCLDTLAYECKSWQIDDCMRQKNRCSIKGLGKYQQREWTRSFIVCCADCSEPWSRWLREVNACIHACIQIYVMPRVACWQVSHQNTQKSECVNALSDRRHNNIFVTAYDGFQAKKDERTEQTSHSKLQMSMKRAFICVSGPGPLTTEIFNG